MDQGSLVGFPCEIPECGSSLSSRPRGVAGGRTDWLPIAGCYQQATVSTGCCRSFVSRNGNRTSKINVVLFFKSISFGIYRRNIWLRAWWLDALCAAIGHPTVVRAVRLVYRSKRLPHASSPPETIFGTAQSTRGTGTSLAGASTWHTIILRAMVSTPPLGGLDGF